MCIRDSLLAVALGVALPACVNSTSERPKHEDVSKLAITLDKGEKWKVNEEMMPFVRNIEKDVNDFPGTGQKDYKSLASSIQKNIDQLVSSCTMEGKGHDELHKWLLPFIDTVKALSKANNDVEAAAQFENVRAAMVVFNQYFE